MIIVVLLVVASLIDVNQTQIESIWRSNNKTKIIKTLRLVSFLCRQHNSKPHLLVPFPILCPMDTFIQRVLMNTIHLLYSEVKLQKISMFSTAAEV